MSTRKKARSKAKVKRAAAKKERGNGKRLAVQSGKLEVVTFRMTTAAHKRLKTFARRIRQSPSEVVRGVVDNLPPPHEMGGRSGYVVAVSLDERLPA